MKRQWLYFVIVVVLAITPALSIAADSILGEWISVERSKGGLGAAKNYNKDGTVQATFGALVDFKYKVTGKKITLSFPETDDIVQKFEIKDSTLVLTDATGNKQELTRIAGDATTGLLGKWTGVHYTGAKQILHFTAAHNCYLAVPMISAAGTYIIMGDILTESYKDKGSQNYKWIIRDNVLILTDGQGKTEKYMRKK